MKIHQLLYGYNNGHQLLAGSVGIESREDNILLDRITDWTGFVPNKDPSTPYMVSAYLPHSNMYAICLTWYADEMERSGCVWSHVLLVEINQITPDFSFLQLLRFFKRPLGGNFRYYGEDLDVTPNKYGITLTMKEWSQIDVILFYVFILKNNSIILYEDRNQSHYHLLGMSLLNYLPLEMLKKASICTGYTRHLYHMNFDFGLKIGNDGESYFINKIYDRCRDIYNTTPEGIRFIGKFVLNQEEHLYSLIRAFSSDIGDDIMKLNAVGCILEAISDDKKYNTRQRISIVFDVLNQYFPKYHQGQRIKSIVLGKDLTDVYTTEKDFLYALSVVHPGVYYETKRNIEYRINTFLKSDENSFLDLVEKILTANMELNVYGKSILAVSFQLAGDGKYNDLVHNHWGTIYPIIQENENLLSSGEWINLKSDDVVNLVNGLNIEKLSTINHWNKVISLLDGSNINPSSELRIYLKDRWTDWKMPLLDKYNTNFKQENPTTLLRIVLEDEHCVVDWIARQFDVDDSFKRLLVKYLNPNSIYIKNKGEDVWFHFAEWESKVVSLDFNIFKFRLGFNWGGGLAHHYIRESFYILHEKLKDDRYNKYIWDRMGSFCNDIFIIKYWDKCAILRKKVVKYFIDNNIAPSLFLGYTPDPVLNKALAKTYKAYAHTLKEKPQ